MTFDADERDGQGPSRYPGPSDPGRRAFPLAMVVTTLVTIGVIAFLVYARIHWPSCWNGLCS